MWKKIEVLLAEKKMTKYELAKKAGLNQNSLIDLKKGRKKSLKFDDVVKIADVLEVSLDEFRKGWEYAKNDVESINHLERAIKKQQGIRH